jgi:protein required for attachment to host cells
MEAALSIEVGVDQEVKLDVLAEPGRNSSTWVIALRDLPDRVACGSARKRRDAEFKALERLVRKIDLEALNGLVGDIIRSRLRINKGAWKEWILLAAFRRLGTVRPLWAKRIRRATTAEEALGIDLVLTSDRGDICFQLKSSDVGVKKFLGKKRRDILIVRFTDEDSPYRILATLLRKAEQRRRRLA